MKKPKGAVREKTVYTLCAQSPDRERRRRKQGREIQLK